MGAPSMMQMHCLHWYKLVVDNSVMQKHKREWKALPLHLKKCWNCVNPFFEAGCTPECNKTFKTFYT